MTRVLLALIFATVLATVARIAVADPFLDAVVSRRIGTGGGARDADLPGVVLGPPRGGGAFTGSLDTFSLGLGGQILVEFRDNVVVDGPGPDLTVFENAFFVSGLTTLPPFAEPGTVSVSADGVTWATFPCAATEPPFFVGCTGVYPVFADADDPASPSPLVPSTVPITSLIDVPIDDFVPPAGSGGDTFDLATVGLAAIRFVRIDASQDRVGLAQLAGFDLDAIAGLHSVDSVGLPDTDGDGVVDAADGCPAVADPAQLDGDRNGVGDACEGTPDVDSDGDGIADTCDPCPSDADCGPVTAPAFTGGGRPRDIEDLLTYVTPTGTLMTLPADSAEAVFTVVVSPEVRAGSVTVRVGRRDVTAELAPWIPGSTRVLRIPLTRRRTIVTLRAEGATSERGRRRVDLDRFTVKRR